MASATSGTTTSYPRETFCDVVVVGSGVSGLRCASELQHAFNLNTLVIEARPAIGGRIKQNHTFLPGRELEVGAEFLHGDINNIVDLVEQNNWGRRQIFTWSHGDGGPSHQPAPDGGVGYYYLGNEGKLMRYDDEDEDFRKCNDALWSLAYVDPAKADADTRNLRQFLLDAGVKPRVIDFADAGYSNTQGGNLDSVPAARACKFERAWEGEGTELDPDFRMEPSFRVLIEHLASGLSIRTGCPVVGIHVDTEVEKRNEAEKARLRAAQAAAAASAGAHVADEHQKEVVTALSATPARPARHAVTVTCKDGSVVHCHKVVVTVPLPVLKRKMIDFMPPLPLEKVRAIDSLKFANAIKIVCKFNRRAWPSDCHGVVCADSYVPECWMNNTRAVGGVIVGRADYMNHLSSTRSRYDILKSKGMTHEEIAELELAERRETKSATDPLVEADRFKIPPIEAGILWTCTGFMMGDRADATCRMPQATVLARFLAQLDRMFNMDASGAFIEGFVASWAEEPYVWGAYTTPTCDEDADAAAALAAPHTKSVYFAGEATAGAVDGTLRTDPRHCVHFTSPIVIHGAIETGSKAACDVARTFGVPVVCVPEDHPELLHEHNPELDVAEGASATSSGAGAGSAKAAKLPKVCCSEYKRHRRAQRTYAAIINSTDTSVAATSVALRAKL